MSERASCTENDTIPDCTAHFRNQGGTMFGRGQQPTEVEQILRDMLEVEERFVLAGA